MEAARKRNKYSFWGHSETVTSAWHCLSMDFVCIYYYIVCEAFTLGPGHQLHGTALTWHTGPASASAASSLRLHPPPTSPGEQSSHSCYSGCYLMWPAHVARLLCCVSAVWWWSAETSATAPTSPTCRMISTSRTLMTRRYLKIK